MKTKGIKQFITKTFNKEPNNFCWYNTKFYVLSQKDLEDLEKYFNEKDFNFMLIINGCNPQRPQRTFFTFPTFLKGVDGSYSMRKYPINAFILCSWMKDYSNDFSSYEEDIKELLSTIPYEFEIKIFKK